MKKKNLYYDVDGVLLDFSGPFANFWNNGLKEHRWLGKIINGNPENWDFGFISGEDNIDELNRGIKLFYKEHCHLPLLDSDIPFILKELRKYYNICFISSYPDKKKRIENLAHYGIEYDIIECNIKDKANYILEREKQGQETIAVFEDSPHHLLNLIVHFPGKVYSPNHWNYLRNLKEEKNLNFYNTPHEWKKLFLS